MFGRVIASSVARGRDAAARALLRLGVSPNAISLAGMVLTVCAGACYAASCPSRPAWNLRATDPANAWGLLALGLLVLSSACDMLDGAVARLGNRRTAFGAFLDSTLDRFSDFAVYAGAAVFYARHQPANPTFVLLSMLAFLNAVMISYTRARAESLLASRPVGYWQRGERSAAILIATAAHNVPALLAQQALLPFLTVVRRVFHTRALIQGRAAPADPPRPVGWRRLRIWRWPRGTPPYNLATAINVAWLVFARLDAARLDLIRRWLA